MVHDTEILKEMQKIQPWLVRVCIPDENFARILKHIDIAVINSLPHYPSDKTDKALLLIKKELKLVLPQNSTMESALAGYIFLWVRYVCLTNKNLYRNVFAACFNNDTIIQSASERRKYVEGRLMGLGIPESQLNDIYYILKGYIDTTFAILKHASRITLNHFEDPDDFILIVNSKYDNTECIKDLLSVDEIAEIVMRDFFSKKAIREIE